MIDILVIFKVKYRIQERNLIKFTNHLRLFDKSYFLNLTKFLINSNSILEYYDDLCGHDDDHGGHDDHDYQQ